VPRRIRLEATRAAECDREELPVEVVDARWAHGARLVDVSVVFILHDQYIARRGPLRLALG
jgi:hypothetical protein